MDAILRPLQYISWEIFYIALKSSFKRTTCFLCIMSCLLFYLFIYFFPPLCSWLILATDCCIKSSFHNSSLYKRILPKQSHMLEIFLAVLPFREKCVSVLFPISPVFPIWGFSSFCLSFWSDLRRSSPASYLAERSRRREKAQVVQDCRLGRSVK